MVPLNPKFSLTTEKIVQIIQKYIADPGVPPLVFPTNRVLIKLCVSIIYILLLLLLLLLLLSDAFHKNVSKAANRAQSELNVEESHKIEDILNKWVFSFFRKQEILRFG